MRNRFRGAGYAVALALVGPAAASADGVIVMPYSCAVIDGKPRLTPSPPQAHRVYGTRESQTVDTCSTIDPKRCRRWTAERFDMACGGTRVPWMQVFANASEHTRRRVWESGGRLRVQNTQMRPKRLDDICARRMPSNLEWSSTSEICEEAARAEAPTTTDMPLGYAPTLGLQARFLTDQEAADLDIAVAAAQPSPTPPVAAAQQQPLQRTGQTALPVALPAAPPATATAMASAISPPAEVPPHPGLATASPTAAPHTPPPEPGASSAAPASEGAKVVVLNVQQPAAVSRVPMVTGSVVPDAVPEVAPEDKREIVREALTGSTPAVLATNDAASAMSQPWRAASYAAMTLASLVLIGMLLAADWFRRVANVPARAQAPGPSPEAAAGPFAVGASPGTALVATAVTPAGAPATSLGDRMPATRPEALALLGMGIASDSNVSSIKKIIDGLRMSWHPDFAHDDADRHARELRMRQINAAWEILGSTPADA